MIKLDDLDLVFTINSTHFPGKLEMTKRSSVSDTLFLRCFVQAVAEGRILTSVNSWPCTVWFSAYSCILRVL